MTEQIAEASPRFKARIAGVLSLLGLLAAVFGEFFVRRLEIAGDLIAVSCMVAVTVLLYDIFKPVNRGLSLLAASFNLVGLTLGALRWNPQGVDIPVAFNGFYCLLIGYLIFNSNFLPRILGALMAFSGLGWLTYLSGPLAHYLSPYNLVLGILGQESVMLWLLVMGVNVRSAVEGTSQRSGDAHMKAAVYTRYGPPDVLQITEVEKPVPKDNEVLIRVRAASVNPYDWHFMRGMPYPVRIAAGLRTPKHRRLGADVAGQVEAIGRNVTQFKPGEEVFGLCKGAFAEYVCALESALVTKPNNVTFEQAASVPLAALTALQGLRDKGHIQPGHKVLINGAAGGVGTFAVQIAKSFGAGVTGVCSTRNAETVRSIGADHVIDYTQEDFTKSGQRYDLILDCIANHSLSACRRVLNPNGTYVIVGGPTGRWMIGFFARLIKALVLSRFVSQKPVIVLAKSSKDDLALLHDLMKAGKVTPVIDRRYSLREVPEAIRYLEEGHARGKVVITLESDNKTEQRALPRTHDNAPN